MLKKLLVIAGLLVIAAVLMVGLKIKSISSTVNTTQATQEPFMKKLQANIFRMTKRSSVYDFMRKSYYTFGVPQKGVIHVGARNGEELEFYVAHDVKNVLWIEADPAAEPDLKRAVAKHPGSKVAMFAASDANGIITLHKTANSGHSSSVLKLKNHLIHYPGITEVEAIQVPQWRLDDYLSAEDKATYNMMVMDIQGAELIALRGATNTLKSIDAIIAEVNYDELYEGCALIGDLDEFLKQQGFTRVDLISVAYYTGDALYVKNKFFKPLINNKDSK